MKFKFTVQMPEIGEMILLNEETVKKINQQSIDDNEEFEEDDLI